MSENWITVEGEVPKQESDWVTVEGTVPEPAAQQSTPAPQKSADGWVTVEGEVPKKHDWGTTDARDFGKTNVQGMHMPERQGAPHDRIILSATQALAQNPTHGRSTAMSGMEKLKTAKNMLRDLEVDPFKTPQYLPHIEKLQKEGVNEIRQYIELRQSIDEDVKSANPALWESVLGSIVGGLTDPVNLLPGFGNGAKLLTTLGKKFTEGALVGVASALEQNDFDKAVGLLKDDPTVMELTKAGLTTGAIAAILSGMLHLKGGYKPSEPKPKVDPDIAARAEKVINQSIPAPKDVDVSNAQAPQYLGAGSKARIAEANAYNDLAVDRGLEQIPADRELQLLDARGRFDPSFLGSEELTAAAEQANRAAQAKTNLLGQDVQLNPLDVDTSKMASPYMNPADLAHAQKMADEGKGPGHSYMEIPEEMGNVPYWPDKALESAKNKANRAVEAGKDSGAPVDISREGSGMEPLKYEPPENVRLAPDESLRVELEKAKAKANALADELTPEDKPKKGFVRMYHGGNPEGVDGPLWFTADLRDAKGWASRSPDMKLWYVDIPENHPARGGDPEFGVIPSTRAELPADIASQRKPFVPKKQRGYIDVEGVEDWSFLKHFKNLSPKNFEEKWKSRTKTILMSPDEFLNMAEKLDKPDPEKAKRVRETDGEWATPWLTITHSGEEAKVTGHEGRHRAMRMKELGYDVVPVEIRSDRIRWSEQQDKTLFDYQKDYPRILRGETSGVMPFPIPRDNGKPFVPKRERGAIYASDIAKGVTDKYNNAVDLINDFKDKLTDIPFFKSTVPMTVNNLGQWLKNPYIDFAYNMRRLQEMKIDERANLYKAYLTDVTDVMNTRRKEALQMINTLVKMQDPSLLEARRFAEDNNTREAFLAQQGMSPEMIPHAIKLLNIFRAVAAVDQAHAMELRSSTWRTEPMYFPIERTGPFTLYIRKSDGTIVHTQPFEHLKGAREFEKVFKENIVKNNSQNDFFVSVERNEAGAPGDLYAMLNISNDNMPPFMETMTREMIKAIEVRKRKFEMERSSIPISGATGTEIYGDKWGWKSSQDDRTLTLPQRRLEQSYSLERMTRILKDIEEPFLSDPTAMLDKDGKEMKNLRNFMQQFVASEMGFDISKTHFLDRSLDKTAAEIGKKIDKAAGYFRGYKGGDVSYFKPHEVGRLTQTMVWTMSAMKLAWNVQTLGANALSGVLVPIDGFRTAGHEGVNLAIPILAGQKTLLSFADPNFKSFMKQMDLEGAIDPRISDPMTLIQTHNRLKLDKVVNAPRDVIEKITNINSIAYYYNYYSLAEPNLNPMSDAFKTKVISAARGWTGDYTQSSTMMAQRQLGYVGQMFSNFAKWKFNQLGRLMLDLQALGEGKFTPIVATLASQLLVAGAYGAVGIVDYEAMRLFLNKISDGKIDWKPFSEYYNDTEKWAKDNGYRVGSKVLEVLKRGLLTYAADKTAKEMGFTSAPDFSSSMRFGSYLDVPALPVSFITDMVKGSSAVGKTLWDIANRENLTNQERKDMLKVLPTAFSKVGKEFVDNKIQTGSFVKQGYKEQLPTQDRAFYPQAKDEKALRYLGLNTVKRNDFAEDRLGNEWLLREKKREMTKQINRMVANADNNKVLAEAANKIFKDNGNEGVLYAIEHISKIQPINVSTAYDEQEAIKMLKKQGYSKAKAIEALQRFLPDGGSQQTSSSR